MHRHSRALVLLLTTLPSPALLAQEVVFQGFETRAEVLPADALTRALSDGRILTFDGESVDLWNSAGAFLANLGVLPGAAEVGAFEVSPDESFALVGEKASGKLYRVAVDGSALVEVGTLQRNASAAFESNEEVLISAGTGAAGGFELWRLHVESGHTDLLASLPGGAGPIALNSNGGAFCMPTRPGELGTTTVYRFGVSELAPSDDTVLAASDGIVAVEVESHTATGDWVEETSKDDFSGDSYYRWDGPDLFHSPGHGKLSWTFEIYEEGEYRLRIRNLHDDGDSTMENDCFVRMDGGEWIKVFSGHDFPTWNWETVFDPEDGGPKTSAAYDLDVGVHTFEISGRSRDFRIDRWHLYRTGTPSPQSLSIPLSTAAVPLNAADATIVIDGLDGAADLEIGTDEDTTLVAETSPLTGISRIHAISGSFVSSPVVLDTGPNTAIEHLDFLTEPADFFFPFQPDGNGELIYHVRNTATGALERRSLAPKRPEFIATGPGVSGWGPIDLELTGGWPGGTAVLISSPANLLNPMESAFVFDVFPYVHTAMDPEATFVLPALFPTDADGAYTLSFSNSLVETGVVAAQMVVLSTNGNIVGSSTTIVL